MLREHSMSRVFRQGSVRRRATPSHALCTKHPKATSRPIHQPPHTGDIAMFSPQPASNDAPPNPAARRRPRPSRPTSRVQQRNERPDSAMSMESSASSHRQGPESMVATSVDVSFTRKSATAQAAKEQDGGATDLVGCIYVCEALGAPVNVSNRPKMTSTAFRSSRQTRRYSSHVLVIFIPHSVPFWCLSG